MAGIAQLIAGVLILCAAGVISGSDLFVEENPIRQVVDGLHELENSIFQVVGNSRHAFSFARFAHRYRKRYEDAEEIQKRFQIFGEMIRSHNRKGLSYPMGVNGHCGSCWTISTTEALEAAYSQAFGKGISLSEQQLVDCAGKFNNFGCNRGLPSQAFEYIKYNGGLETEDSYPCTGLDGSCKYSSENAVVKVVDSVNISLGAEDELKQAVAFVRPVSVAFEVVNGFRAYNGGVYTSTSCGHSPMVAEDTADVESDVVNTADNIDSFDNDVRHYVSTKFYTEAALVLWSFYVNREFIEEKSIDMKAYDQQNLTAFLKYRGLLATIFKFSLTVIHEFYNTPVDEEEIYEDTFSISDLWDIGVTRAPQRR